MEKKTAVPYERPPASNPSADMYQPGLIVNTNEGALYPRIIPPSSSSSPPGGPRISNPPSPVHGIARKSAAPLPTIATQPFPPPSVSPPPYSVTIGEYVPPSIPNQSASSGGDPSMNASPPTMAMHSSSSGMIAPISTAGPTMVSLVGPPTRYHRLVILRHGAHPLWIPIDQYPTRPVMTLCGRCSNWGISRIDKSTSGTGWLFSGIMCLVGLWPCACIPCCMDDCQIVQHSCRSCGALIGDSSSL